jgi:hypothetical protein
MIIDPRRECVDFIARSPCLFGATVTQLCAREKCSVRQVNMTISLAFLAPNLGSDSKSSGVTMLDIVLP